jgi:hypothetical protein
MVAISALLMVLVSWLTARPSAATIDRYFPQRRAAKREREMAAAG